MNHYDLIGVGIGPFHLSLASLMQKATGLTSLFFDQKPGFQWHPELMFHDADMQTSYMKDLVTPVDPTSPYSFMNYLVEHGIFYAFMNTGRRTVTRFEFDQYCSWVSSKLEANLIFNSPIREVSFQDDHFKVQTDQGTYTAKNISIATGMTPRIPECAKNHLGPKVFHAKSGKLNDLDLREKKVVVIGGGQTGVELFRNALNGKWGRVESLRLISRRQNLEPLDESPFTNEFFTPSYVDQFFGLDQESKDPIVKAQKLASDGNTPQYLDKLYNDIYRLKHVVKDDLIFQILPCRNLTEIAAVGNKYQIKLTNNFAKVEETLEADIIILCTGFTNSLPRALDPLLPHLVFDSENRLIVKRNFDLDWKGPVKNKIYALNFSRHRHGIAEPQTSLMAWRSGTIVNDLADKRIYTTLSSSPVFIHYGKID